MRRVTAFAACGLMAVLLLATTASAASPTISSTIDGIAGTNGWYRGSTHGNMVVLHWNVSANPAPTSTSGCEPAISIPGPTSGTTKTCTATNTDGTSTSSKTVKIDADPPTGLSASPVRPPDFNGWYNHPVAVNWSGSDATSGIVTCTSLIYGGPEGAGVGTAGGCTDAAGNTASTGFALSYDATPPALRGVSVSSKTAADVVRWRSSSPGDKIVVRRAARGNKAVSTVFQGAAPSFADKTVRPGIEYIYSVRAFDQAGNASRETSVVGLPKVLTLRKTPYVPRAAPRPVLRWESRRGARYYHVQLFRGSKRILAKWPTTHQLGLPLAWRWAGQRQRLGPGRYRWYVWAGIGARSFARYRTIGSAQFVVPRSY
jgi:hypothetical protein